MRIGTTRRRNTPRHGSGSFHLRGELVIDGGNPAISSRIGTPGGSSPPAAAIEPCLGGISGHPEPQDGAPLLAKGSEPDVGPRRAAGTPAIYELSPGTND